MPLFKSAPTVTIRAPNAVFVGQQMVVEIQLETAEELEIEYVEIRVEGRQGWSIGSGKHQVSFRVTFPELVGRLMGGGTLPAGTTRLRAPLTLPEGTAPSHAISPAYAELHLRVRVAIPWWADGRYKFELPVRLSPGSEPVTRTPRAIRSTRSSAAPDQPRIEIGLASTRLIAGELLVGSCAVFHLDDDEPRTVDVSLVPQLVLRGRGRDRDREGSAHTMRLTLPAGSAGTSVPFQFTVPENLTPSFETASHHLRWFLTARSGSFFGKKVEVSVPLEIVDRSAIATTATLTEAPQLADVQVAASFARFAALRGWTLGAARPDDARPGETAGDPYVEHQAGDCTLRITYSYRGQEGTFVVARAGYPSLGLALTATPSSALRHVFFHDVEAGIAAWDRDHHVRARIAEQAVPFLHEVVPVAQTGLGDLVRWDDDAIVFQRKVVSVDVGELEALGARLEQLAAAIDAARTAIPPPTGVTVDRAAWLELARWMHGTLAMGDLSIEGEVGGMPAELGLTWYPDGEPITLRVQVGDLAMTAPAQRAIRLMLPMPGLDALATPAAEPLVGLLTGWPEDIVDLRIADGVAAAHLRLPADRTADAARVRELAVALRAVLAALDPAAGPYR